MSIRKLTEYAKKNGISADEYAAHLMDTAEACHNALAELSRYVDKIVIDAESKGGALAAIHKAKCDELEYWKGRCRELERAAGDVVDHFVEMFNSDEDPETVICSGHGGSVTVEECEQCGECNEDATSEAFKAAQIVVSEMAAEDAAIIERAEMEDGFHGQ